MINRRISLSVVAVAAMAVLIPCFTALAVSEAANNVIYNYSAKETVFDRKTGITILKGDAKVRSNGDHLNADQITIYRDVKTGELIKIDAVGNVDMNEKGMAATCEHAILYEAEERIELEGSEDSPAEIDDGKNKMKAPAITYFQKEDRIEAKGNVTGQVVIVTKESETVEGEEETEEKGEK